MYIKCGYTPQIYQIKVQIMNPYERFEPTPKNINAPIIITANNQINETPAKHLKTNSEGPIQSVQQNRFHPYAPKNFLYIKPSQYDLTNKKNPNYQRSSFGPSNWQQHNKRYDKTFDDKNKINTTERKYGNFQKIAEDKTEELKVELAKCKIQNSVLHQKYNHQNISHEVLKTSFKDLQKRNADLIQKFAINENKIFGLQSQLHQISGRLRNAEISEISLRLKAQQENKNYQSKLSEMKLELEKASRTLKESINKHEIEVMELNKEKWNLTNQIKEERRKNIKVEEANKQLQAQVLEKKEKESASYQQRKKSLSKNNQTNTTQKANFEKKIATLTKQNNDLYEQVDLLAKTLDEMNKLNQSMQMKQQLPSSNELQSLTSRINYLLQQNNDLKNQARQLNRKVKETQFKAKLVSQALFGGYLKQIIESMIDTTTD